MIVAVVLGTAALLTFAEFGFARALLMFALGLAGAVAALFVGVWPSGGFLFGLLVGALFIKRHD